MKLRKLFYLGLVMLLLVGCSKTDSNNSTSENVSENTEVSSDFHIGIVTGTVAQTEDGLRGAEEAIKLYGDANEGGIIVHETYPDNFMSEQETTISKITMMAEDPLMKAIIVNQAIPGTVAAFEQIKETNPDILLIAIIPQEDTSMIEDVADLVLDIDYVSRGYRLVAAAKEMGAETFVHISFPRHMSVELVALRAKIMEEAAKEYGMEFVYETAPDPTSDVGVAGAQQYIVEQVPQWINKYGVNTAFFTTNAAHTEPLISSIAQGGAIFVEQSVPSPIIGYPAAYSVDLEEEAGDWQAINKKVEEAVVAAGNGGRMGTWAYSLEYTVTLALVQLIEENVEDLETKLTDIDTVTAYLENYTQGASWMGDYYTDRSTGELKENHLLVAQDTYVYGLGFLGMDKVEVPEEYLNMNIND